MQTFFKWLVFEDRQVDPFVKQSYEAEFHRALQDLIRRTKDPILKQTFQKMLDCPIEDQRGQCKPFTDYILGALIRNGVHARFDMEAALGYVFEKMMMPALIPAIQGPRCSVASMRADPTSQVKTHFRRGS